MNPPIAPGLVDSAGMVVGDVQCRRCGYSVRGLPADGVCPECATPVGRSLLGDLLKFAEPAWVRKVASGMSLILWGILVGILFNCIAGAFGRYFQDARPLFALVVTLGGSLLGVIGTWMMTSRDPSGIGEDSAVNARKIVRATLIVGMAGGILNGISPLAPGDAARTAIAVVGGLCMIVSLLGEWYRFLYYETIARRIPDPRLAGRSRFLRWAYVCSLGAGLAGGAIVLAAHWATGDVTSGVGPVGVLLVGLAALGVVVFGLLTLLLLLRLRRAVSAEAQQAELIWRAGGGVGDFPRV